MKENIDKHAIFFLGGFAPQTPRVTFFQGTVRPYPIETVRPLGGGILYDPGAPFRYLEHGHWMSRKK